ncbi:MAG: adenylate/guanylate cyclase domain-containing protein [Acidobacteria bacterium]|nr:adenylate/guanylate cyclase domain-containing protein [Acidobacteriota bacterium]
MQPDYEELCNSLSMTEIIRLQTLLSTALVRRFERTQALAFSDLVASTPYFARFGDEAGRKLQQKHLDLVQQSIAAAEGRVVDTAGDGAFLCFAGADLAVSSMLALLRRISEENATCTREHQLAVRIGIHHGPVLTDGLQVAGDAVNYCSRVTASSSPGEIRLSKEAFFACTETEYRLKCRPLPPVSLKGIERPAELLVLDWRDHSIFPTCVQLETGEEIPLPEQDIISFGRLQEKDGLPANDIVLRGRQDTQTRQISRWHFELRRRPDGFALRALSDSPTHVNGSLVAKGEVRPIRPGDAVRVGNTLSLFFPTYEESPTDTDGSRTIIER